MTPSKTSAPAAEATSPSAQHDIPEFARVGDRLMTVGGRRLPAVSGQTLANVNPATESPLASIPRGSAEDVDVAVKAAHAAFHDPSWSGIDPDERSRILFQIATVVEQHADELAAIDTVNMGGPITLTRWMLTDVVKVFRHYAGWPTKIYGQTAPAPEGRVAYTRRQPLGVIGAIFGWNGPMLQMSYKVAAALATGNTVVIKPPEWASLSTMRFVELLEETDLPPGVVNVVTGTGAEAGEALVQHPDVAKIAFTGSTKTGKHLHEVTSADLKHLTLELGGKSPFVVFADADLQAAAQSAAAGFLMGSGQACVAGTRIFVQESVRAEFASLLTRAMDAYAPGDPMDPQTLMGPLASRQHFERVTSYFDIATKDGATVLRGGHRHGDHGLYVEPTLLDGVTADMRVAREEIFGPVAALMSFTDLDDAVAQSNHTEYGLAASIWTKDLATAHRMAERVDAGTIWVNTYGEMSTGALPFGGFKQSGLGREHGLEVLDAYTQAKAVLIAL